MNLGDRLRLAMQQVDNAPDCPRPSTLRLAREGSYLFSPLSRRIRRKPLIEKAKNPQIVLLLPGFIATPRTMRYLARQIERAGHKAKEWKIGFNGGVTPERLELLEQRMSEVRERYGVKPVLLGWSLGGMFARELAHRQPDSVSKVITMGSPFSGSPRANNAWRLYQFVAGHDVEHPPIKNRVSQKPPVETVALWSPLDGVVSAESARGTAQERDRDIELACTHMGFSYRPEVVEALCSELDRP